MEWYEIIGGLVVIIAGAFIGIKAKDSHKTSTTMIVGKIGINRKDADEVSFFIYKI